MNFRALLFALLTAVWMQNMAVGQDAQASPLPVAVSIEPPAPSEPPAIMPLEELRAIELHPQPKSGTPIDLTIPHEDLWDRVRNNFAMTDLDSPLVDRHQAWYTKQPEYLRRVIERSRRYLHHIVEEIEKRGMPSELALLPIVESSYNPLAISTARASGLWQFIPSTGRNYKLDQTWWVDERRDIVASTDAALEYLQYIYEMHGDWQLALASYNWGEGAVGRAIAKNKAKGLPTDYSSLKMPKETQNYVPKLQALKNILSDRALWASLNIPSIDNKPYFSTITKPADMDVRMAARFAEMPIEDFRALNPAHNRPVIRANIPIILPAEKVDTFASNFAQNDDPLVSWHTYTFQKTDKIEKLAARVGMPVPQFKAVNGISGKKARVVPGQMLLLPSPELIALKEPLDTFAPPPAPEKRWQRSKSGSKKVAATKKATSSTSKSSKPSTTNKRASSAQTSKPKLIRDTARKGDTVESVARRHNVPASAITKHNRVKAGIKPGQTLLIPEKR